VTGGTSRKDHSEIGSGSVHFNFDPRGDKFGSLLGDARGFLLRSKRIFVGGNCGLVAPLHIGFGSVLAAGSTLRWNVKEGELACGAGAPVSRAESFEPEIYYDLRRKFVITAKLIGTLRALGLWYRMVRIPFADSHQIPLYESATCRLAAHIAHRLNELDKVISKLQSSLSSKKAVNGRHLFEGQHKLLVSKRDRILSMPWTFDGTNYPPVPPSFLKDYAQRRNTFSHADSILNLRPDSAEDAAIWLRDIAAEPVVQMERLLDGVHAVY
jgi:UDP-N-acetylglucosamine/UDP-N-acetylgalactosamine diphosphorylase